MPKPAPAKAPTRLPTKAPIKAPIEASTKPHVRTPARIPPPQIDKLEALKEFRKQVFEEGILEEGDSIGTDDETLLRFLRARKFDLKESKKMIRNCQKWRKTVEGVGIDELYLRIDPFDFPEREAVFQYWQMWFHKTDKKGRPVNIHSLGGMDVPNLYKVCSPERHWQTVLVNCESLTREILPASSRAAGHSIGTGLVIVDLRDFGLAQFLQMKSLVKKSFQLSQDYYPETMAHLVVVNAPPGFTIVWTMIRPWLSKDTANKVQILGTEYRDVLLELVDADNLPSTFGGKCECKEYGGCHLSGYGPWMNGRVRRGKSRSAANNPCPDGPIAGKDALNQTEQAAPPTLASAASDTATLAQETVLNGAEDLSLLKLAIDGANVAASLRREDVLDSAASYDLMLCAPVSTDAGSPLVTEEDTSDENDTSTPDAPSGKNISSLSLQEAIVDQNEEPISSNVAFMTTLLTVGEKPSQPDSDTSDATSSFQDIIIVDTRERASTPSPAGNVTPDTSTMSLSPQPDRDISSRDPLVQQEVVPQERHLDADAGKGLVSVKGDHHALLSLKLATTMDFSDGTTSALTETVLGADPPCFSDDSDPISSEKDDLNRVASASMPL